MRIVKKIGIAAVVAATLTVYLVVHYYGCRLLNVEFSMWLLGSRLGGWC